MPPVRLKGTVAAGNAGGRGNDGSGAKPPGAIDVNGAAALYTALASATPGNIFYLATGNYGDLDFSGFYGYAAPGVTIYGQTGVTANYINCNGAAGITFRYMTITAKNAVGRCVELSGSRLAINHLSILPSDTDNLAFFGEDFNTVSITNCLFGDIGSGIETYASDAGSPCLNLTVLDNKITSFITDAFLLIRTNNVTVLRNYIGPTKNPNDSDHPDALQLQTCDTVEVGYNNFDNTGHGTFEHCGGIGFSENIGNFNYHHNCSFGADDNGMSLGNACHDGVVSTNFSQGVTYSGRIIVRDASHDIEFDNNQVSLNPPIVDYAGGGANYNITYGTGGNVNVTIAKASSYSDTTLRNAFVTAHSLPVA